jgi:hypothetical protein
MKMRTILALMAVAGQAEAFEGAPMTREQVGYLRDLVKV